MSVRFVGFLTSEFLQIKQLPLQAYPYLGITPDGIVQPGTEPEGRDTEAHALEDTLRTAVRQDRALYELGLRAFVSWVKAYSKHEVSYIFRLTDLPLGGMACQFVLLHLPRMPEMRTWHNEGTLFVESTPDVRTCHTHISFERLLMPTSSVKNNV